MISIQSHTLYVAKAMGDSGFDAEGCSSLIPGRKRDVLSPPARPGNEAKCGSGEVNFRQWS